MDNPHISDGKTCGQLLTGLRVKSGKSLRGAAADMGVAQSTLLQLEHGRLPKTDTLIVILKHYGVTATIGAQPEEES